MPSETMFALKVLQGRPSEPCGWGRSGAPVQVWRDLADTVCAYGYAGDGWWGMEWPGVGRYRFGPAVGAGIVEALPEPGVPPERLEDVFNRSVRPLVLQVSGCEALHASAVSTPRGVLGFCGERRAGKSTVAFGLRRRGFAQHADDTLVLSVAPNLVTTVPLPFAPRLRSGPADFFRGVREDVSPALTSGAARQQLGALFILRPDHQAGMPVARPLAPSEAFRAVLAHAHCFEPENPAARRRLLLNYMEVSAVIPAFDVSYEPGLDRLGGLLDTVLNAAGVNADTMARA